MGLILDWENKTCKRLKSNIPCRAQKDNLEENSLGGVYGRYFN
jgi:hypothetical protein